MNQIMKSATMGIVLMILLGVFACSAKPATLVKYEKHGVSFSHLSDWTVTGDAMIDAGDGSRSIELEGPRQAVMSIIIMPASTEMTLEAYAGAMAQERAAGIKQVLSIGAVSPAKVTPTMSGKTTAQVGGVSQTGIMQTFNVELLGQTVPHRSTLFRVADQARQAYIITQVATEDVQHVAPGFDAALASFRFYKPQ